MKNTLGKNIHIWESIKTNDQVLEWIKQGVKFPLNGDIPTFENRNKVFNETESAFLQTEIERLLLLGHIDECTYKPKGISPINCVKKKSGKFRLVTDLRVLNSQCTVPKFKQEDIQYVFSNINNTDYMVTIDLKDGFFHIPVNKEDQEYLGFSFKGRYYKWTVLPFGHCSSPFFFAKTLRPVISYLRSIGIRTVVYVDDFIVLAPLHLIRDHRSKVINILEQLGFTINYEKSSLNPSQTKVYLGHLIDNTGSNTVIKVTGDRVRKLKRTIRKALQNRSVQARTLARIAGQCVSMCKCIFPAKLMLRNIYRLLNSKVSWRDQLVLDSASIIDLQWWLSSIDSWNGKVVKEDHIDFQLTTDASSAGWGGWIQTEKAQGFWTRDVSRQSSNYRELSAVLMSLLAFKEKIKGKTIQVLSDNITTVAMINGMGGHVKSLDEVTRTIFRFIIQNNITISAQYIAGKDNSVADRLSRSKYEWKLHPALFQFIDRVWGPHQVDRFASMTSTQLPIYNSLYLDPYTSGVDAFAQNWTGKNNFVNAPFALIPRILKLLKQQKVTATIIAPKWPAQPWYKELLDMSISPPIPLPVSNRTIRALNKPEPLKNPRWQICAWRVCGQHV